MSGNTLEAVKVRRFPAMQTATPRGAFVNAVGGRMVVVLVVVVDVVVDVVDVVSGRLSAVAAITSRSKLGSSIATKVASG